MAHYRLVHRPGGVIHSLVYHILFAGRGLATFTRKSIPSNVLATVRSWIRGFSGSHLFSSLFIRASVSNSFVYDFLLTISHLFVHAHVVSTFSWSLPAPSDVACHNASCRWSVHSERVRDHKIIFLLVLKSPHDSLCVRVIFGFFVAFCLRSENLLQSEWRGRSPCSVENHYLHIEYKKTLNCLYKCINDCLIHTNAVQECYWIANSVIKMLMNGLCTILFACCLYWISRWCKWLEC